MIEPPPPAGTGARPAPELAASPRDATPNGAAASRQDDGGGDSRLEASAVDGRASRVTPAPRARVTDAALGNGGGRGGRYAAGRAGQPAAQELTTEFIPLVQDAQYQQAGDAHLVRVELPRAALASFGLPVNVESPAGRVKADVLMGEDGVARAIRFVR
jgi:hypothetical protein